MDRRLALQDVEGSLAWAQALHQAGLLLDDEGTQISRGLIAIANEFSNGTFSFAPDDEDIHTAVERRLTELIGPAAGKLHTGRSRNDQVATDFRLWMLQSLPALQTGLAGLQSALIGRAEAANETLMPGYTHLQRAQPILLAHWWMSHFWPLERDRDRLAELTQARFRAAPGFGRAGRYTGRDGSRRVGRGAAFHEAFAQQPGCGFRPRLRRRVFILRAR